MKKVSNRLLHCNFDMSSQTKPKMNYHRENMNLRSAEKCIIKDKRMKI